MIRTGKEYRAELHDGREIWIEGERVPDVTAHPAFKPVVDCKARMYDMAHEASSRDVMSYCEADQRYSHRHDDLDEVLIVVEGQLDVRIGGEHHLVGADHTISLPAGVPHSFVAVGPSPARFYAFLPKQGAQAVTTYLEGDPPLSADQR